MILLAPVDKIDSYLLIVHFTIGFFFPTANLIRALFVSLNIFSIICKDRSVASKPNGITIYGGSILYLIIQAVILFIILVWWDSGSAIGSFFRRRAFKSEDAEGIDSKDEEISAELARVDTSTDDGLRVLHISKSFGRNRAVQDVSFGVKRGEVFALLGPNGAGKSTTISMIRGDIRPSNNGGDIFIENTSVIKHRATARTSLGVCPQFDAVDQMTVLEHLRFYARIRGVRNIEHNVHEIVRAVGLGAFQTRMAASLSGGNKRKLSLGVALMGNPTVLLLDEPSSGLDVKAKRIMWATLASVAAGRSIVLTTHSMEEADALASRAGIMAGRMLALGTSDYLRKKHGDRYHVHLLMKTAPYTPTTEVDIVKTWIVDNFQEAIIDNNNFHGQIRFSIPASSRSTVPDSKSSSKSSTDDDAISRYGEDLKIRKSGISALFSKLESNKHSLGFEYYSVSQTTLDQVFLSIVGKHNVEEENYEKQNVMQKRPLWKRLVRR